MTISRKDLEKSQVELTVELTAEEFSLYVEKGARAVSERVSIEGFRPGKAPYDLIKQKVGEMTILEEAAHIAVSKTIDEAIEKELKGERLIGQPQVSITKIAPQNPLEYKVLFAKLPEVKLGAYKDLKIKQEKLVVEEKEIEKALSELCEVKAKETASEEAIKNGDKVMADVEMFLDKVPLENGQAKGVTILVGKDYFVSGFDKQIAGLKKGEHKEFSLLYPEDHFRRDLAGKNVDFKVSVKEVLNREIPAADDEIAKSFAFKDLEEFKGAIKKNIETQRQSQIDQKTEIKMLDEILDKTKFGELPDLLIHNETELMLKELEQSISSEGGNLSDYLASLNKTREQMALDFMPNAVKRVKVSLIIREIANEEKIIVTPEEIQARVEEVKRHYQNDERVQKMASEPAYRNYLDTILSNQKVIKSLREWNIIKE